MQSMQCRDHLPDVVLSNVMSKLQTGVLHGGSLRTPALNIGEADRECSVAVVQAQQSCHLSQVTEVCKAPTTKPGIPVPSGSRSVASKFTLTTVNRYSLMGLEGQKPAVP